MLKAFCDSCEAECDPNRPSTRRVEKLQGIVGLEVIPLFNSRVDPQKHICDDCIASSLVDAAFRYIKAPRIVDLTIVMDEANTFKKVKSEIFSQSESLKSDRKEILDLIAEAKTAIEEVKKLPNAEAEKIKLLQATIEALEAKTMSKLKQDTAAQEQEAIDRKDYPEYSERVQRRERMRVS